jgi:tRNA(Ile)-lysidine synthase
VPWPLELRRRRPGDRFDPDGGVGSKKLKAWLIDRKIPRERRGGLWLVARGAEVLAIPELAALSRAAGPGGMGLDVRLEG